MNTWRKVGTIAAAVLAAAGVGIAAISSMPGSAIMQPEPVTGAEVLALMLRSGLEAEAMAAVGLSAADAASMFEQYRLYANSSPAVTEGIRGAVLNARSARAAQVQHARAQQAGLATDADLATATRTAEGATTVLNDAMSFATSQLTRAQRANLLALRSRASWEIPIYVKLTERSEAEWVALRDAYAARAIAQTRGEPPSPNAVRLIERAETDPAARNAKANVQANAAAIDDILRTFAR